MVMKNIEMEMKLEMLVDDELPEQDRAAMLRGMSEAEWKELSLRFLQRQVERKGVRQLIDAGSVYPEDRIPAALPFRKKESRKWAYGIAAGLMIAVASAAITFLAMRGDNRDSGVIANVGGDTLVTVAMPAAVLPDGKSREVSVEVTNLSNEIIPAAFMTGGGPGTENSVVIKKIDGNRVIAVPVSTKKVNIN
jgi:hypothetical protein